MYNLDVSLAATAATAANCLLAEGGGTTPRTPEILNSLIAMTNPLDGYHYGDDTSKAAAAGIRPPQSICSDSNSSSCSQVESPTNNPPSVRATCSQLIKAGLKLSIEQKRKHQNDQEDLLDLDKVKRVKKIEASESEDDKIKQESGIRNCRWYENDDSKLTPEDEERRRRRRERNKVAATKCRLKKRERTANLIHESEVLETQHIELKAQLEQLQKEEKNLLDMLSLHRHQCQHNIGPATRDALYRLPPVSSVMDNYHGTHNRPASVDSFRQQPGSYNRPASAGNQPYRGGFVKPPSIVVEEIEDYNLEYIDLESFQYNQCHNFNSQGYGGSGGMGNGCLA